MRDALLSDLTRHILAQLTPAKIDRIRNNAILGGYYAQAINKILGLRYTGISNRLTADEVALVRPVARSLMARDALRSDDFGGLILRVQIEMDAWRDVHGRANLSHYLFWEPAK